MKMQKNSKNLRVVLICVVLTLAALLTDAVIEKHCKENVVIPTMPCDRYFVPMDFSPEDGAKEIALQFVHEGSELPGLAFNTNYPCYQNNGATIFLYEADYGLVFADFSKAEGKDNLLVSDGAIFEFETAQQLYANVHFLQIPDTGYCMNLKEFALCGEINATIPRYSLICLEKGSISWYEYYRGRLRYQKSVVTPNTRVSVGEMNGTYYEWLAKWEGEDINSPSLQEAFDTSLYFYDMMQRFEIKGESMFRRTEGNRLLLDHNSVLFDVHGIALYYAEDDAALLPGGFGLVQPWSKTVNALPEMTKLIPDIGAVYLEMPERVIGVNDAFVYSDSGCYLFLDETEFVIGDIRVKLDPLSMVQVEDSLKISVFQYQSKEFSTYTVSGPIPYVELGHGLKLRPLQGSLEWSDRTTEVLITTPSILPVLQ